MQNRLLGKTGFHCSPLGFGSYRIDEMQPEHEIALTYALEQGVNLIDTSTNYGDGGAEKLIGKVLKKSGRRENLFIVTKAGYVQGQAMQVARERIGAGRPFTDMVQLGADLWHCISPDFLEDQLTRSLERLQLEKVDALLLHNPEYFLKKNDDHTEYYRRIRIAFEYLETEVAGGRIRYYGVSSNTFPDATDSKEFTSLELILEIAKEVGPHFALIQFPMNLLEGGGLLEASYFGKSVLELAQENNLGVLINRPLNAFHDHHLIRLASFPWREDQNTSSELKDALKEVLTIEARFTGHDIVDPARIAWGHILKDHLDRIQSIDQWASIRHHQTEPALNNAYEALEQDPGQAIWIKQHRDSLVRAMDALASDLESRASLISRQIQLALERSSPSLEKGAPLSQQALSLYLSLSEISCVLVGMRKMDYVADSIRATKLKPVPRAEVRESLLHAGKFL